MCVWFFFFFFFFFSFFFARGLETKAELVLSSPLDVTKDPVHAWFDFTHALDTKNHRSD